MIYMTLSDEQKTEITSALQHYLKQEFVLITDFEKVIDNRTEITENEETIYEYPCPCQTIWLDTNNYAITYGKQHIISTFYDENGDIIYDENNMPEDCDETGTSYDTVKREYYYDFNPDLEDIAGTYEYIAPLEWMRSDDIWR